MQGLAYRVGRFTLEPRRRLLDNGVPVPVGRKPLEVLSVLAEAQGQLVTKEELMAAVWPNLIVEENAVQAQIAALRRVLASDADLLTTVRGYGYRLSAIPARRADSVRPLPDPVPSRAAAAASPSVPRSRRWIAAPLALAPVVALGVALGVRAHRPPPATPTPAVATKIGLLPFAVRASTPAAAAFADALTDRIAGTLEDGEVPVLSANTAVNSAHGDVAELGRRLGTDLLVDGTVRGVGDTLEVQARLEDARERAMVWSATIAGDAADPDALAAQVAARVAYAVQWASTGRTGRVRLDAATLAAFIAGRENMTGVRDGGNGVALSEFRQVTRAAPDFPLGHSAVAVTAAFVALGPVEPSDAARLYRFARAEAARALTLDPRDAESYLALELALPRTAWLPRDRLLRKGAELDPSFGPDILMEGRLLWSVGRTQDAIGWLQRANGLDPLHGRATGSLAVALAAGGRPVEARRLAERLHREWPDLDWTRSLDVSTALATGDDQGALAAIAADTRATDGFRATWRTALRAAVSGDRAAKRRAADAVVQALRVDAISVDQAVILLARLGDVEQALSIAPRIQYRVPGGLPALFLPATAPLRADPRFMRVAGALGLTAFWQASGVWPDFCDDPHLPYDCRAEAAKLSGNRAVAPAPPRLTSR